MKRYLPSVAESIQFATGSSQIEGENSAEAIRDHLQAWEKARGWGTSIDLKKILECHAVLQAHLRPDIAGKLRTVPVHIMGNYESIQMPSPDRVPFLLEAWLDAYGDVKVFEGKRNIEDLIMRAHVDFEKIHPFEDGNGRIGRCILNWHRVMNELPLFIVTPGKKQTEYYKLFK